MPIKLKMNLNKLVSLFLLGLLSVMIAVGMEWAKSSSALSYQNHDNYQIYQNLPQGIPKPVIPADNPMNAAKVELGRYLFYEKRLSITQEFSCASCHLQKLAFTDGKPLSVGATGEIHPRNAMSLTNIAYSPVLTWANPLLTNLEFQSLIPLFGEHPVEMGMVGREEEIVAMLGNDRLYPQIFAAAFGNSTLPISPQNSGNSVSPAAASVITISNLTKALAAFQRSLISFDSPYDRYRYRGETNAISAAAKRGEILFNSENLECFHCHSGLNFTDSIKHDRLAFKEIAFHNTGLYNLDDQGAYPPENTGLYEITENPADMGKFKVPSLRNIALTAPYMHDGSVATLEEAIEHYAAGGRTIATGKYAGVGRDNPLKSSFINGFTLSSQEKQDLLEFLRSLTDENFLTNPAFSDPH